MSFWDIFSAVWKGILSALGLESSRPRTVIFVGLDNAGKTTLLFKLKHGTIRQFVPTERAFSEEVTVSNLTMRAWDLGGHEQVRKLWQDYYQSTDAVIFIVDAADRDRFGEARQELVGLLEAGELQDTPIAVLANKCDLQYAATFEELRDALGIAPFQNNHNIQLFRVSVVSGAGYLEAFKWLGRSMKP
eukprot:c1118_g1_i1.p1 GENE.c1118_g1_i1~~c1118_g1_i1.p1  ORF type:complete len:211 (-),score=50.61 c1118_g1_i1:115-681(-)